MHNFSISISELRGNLPQGSITPGAGLPFVEFSFGSFYNRRVKSFIFQFYSVCKVLSYLLFYDPYLSPCTKLVYNKILIVVLFKKYLKVLMLWASNCLGVMMMNILGLFLRTTQKIVSRIKYNVPCNFLCILYYDGYL